MNGVLGHDSALWGYTGPGTTWANALLINDDSTYFEFSSGVGTDRHKLLRRELFLGGVHEVAVHGGLNDRPYQLDLLNVTLQQKLLNQLTSL